MNDLILELEGTSPPKNYHQNEDKLAEYIYKKFNWQINKLNNRWAFASYKAILDQRGFGDIDKKTGFCSRRKNSYIRQILTK